MPRILKDRNKDEFMAFEKTDMYATAYEAKLHALSGYATNW